MTTQSGYVGNQKEIVRVLDAVKAGCLTSAQIEAMTGIPLHHASVWLGQLAEAGLVRRIARKHHKSRQRYVRDYDQYEIIHT